jgi:manganese transport protein
MGEYANRKITDILAIVGSAIVLALNFVLLAQTFGVPIPGLPVV